MLLIFARAGEFFPALNLFDARAQGGEIVAAGFVCNLPLRAGQRLEQLEPHQGSWRPMPGGVGILAPADLPKTFDTFGSPWRSAIWQPET